MNSSLNHLYRVVWNCALQVWQVVSEIANSQGKSKAAKAARALKSTAVAVALLPATTSVWSQAVLPTGGVVTQGSATIATGTNSVGINQTTDKAVIDWQSFNVGQGKSVNFTQPSANSIALNRVLGSDTSVIAGSINANGQIFLVNQNGVMFTSIAQVNVGGMVASTQAISNEDFLAGKYKFSGDSSASIENRGSIRAADGGVVALIAATIVNSGTVTANGGFIGLASGNAVELNLGGPVNIKVTSGALNTLIEQGGVIVADGGRIYLTALAAGELASSAINHTGLTQAQTLSTNQKGEIVLIADMSVGKTTVAGKLDASAPNGGNGGFIETSAAKVKIAEGSMVTTLATAENQSGHWLIDPTDFTIAAGGGDMTGAQVSSSLANGNVTIQSTQGANGTAGDVNVYDPITWGSNTTLILSAQRNVNINADITATGVNGKLALEFGQASANGVVGGVEADYYIQAGNKVNLKAGQNFSTKLGDSEVRAFTVLDTFSSFLEANQSTGGAPNLFALGSDLSASSQKFNKAVFSVSPQQTRLDLDLDIRTRIA